MSNYKTFVPEQSLKRSAFSLIELSIVLIIIGLLVAGVTGGAALIKTAELRSVMSEARGYNVAVNSFYVQYDALPGDYDTAIATSLAGNNNGFIEYGSVNDVAEGVNAYDQLVESGILDDEGLTITAWSATTDAFVAQIPGTHMPESKVKGGGWTFGAISAAAPSVSTSDASYAILTGATVATEFVTLTYAPLVPTGILSPSDAVSIDTKTDDGDALTGTVRSILNGVSTPTTGTCYDSDDGVYYSTETDSVCVLAFEVDVI